MFTSPHQASDAWASEAPFDDQFDPAADEAADPTLFDDVASATGGSAAPVRPSGSAALWMRRSSI